MIDIGEETYMDKPYCLECSVKHGRDVEHHLSDLVTSSKNDPRLREKAQTLLDNQRDIRKALDEMRIEELANKKLKDMI